MRTEHIICLAALTLALNLGLGCQAQSSIPAQRPQVAENQQNGLPPSMIWLLRTPATLGLQDIKRVFADCPSIIIEKSDYGWTAKDGPWTYAILVVNQPYTDKMEKEAQKFKDPQSQEAFKSHSAWISIDLMESPPNTKLAEAYQKLLPRAVKLSSDRCLMLLDSTGHHARYGPELMKDLAASGQHFFQVSATPQVSAVPTESLEMQKAVSKAQENLPLFRQRYLKRAPHEIFAMKARFEQGSNVEHMWLEVTQISGTTIKGRLVSAPSTINDVKQGDPCEIPDARVTDWVISDSRSQKVILGGYTLPVVEREGH